MNLRTIFISSFLSLSSLGVLAQERINLSGTWQFAFAANQKEADRLERFYTSDFAKSKFKSTPVPSNWAIRAREEREKFPITKSGRVSLGRYQS